jgi:uncharacterized protein (TIGR03000 family)
MWHLNMRKAAIVSLLAVGAVLLAPATSEAQWRGGGYRGGGYGGNGGYYGGGYNNGGYYGGGYRGGIGISIGRPGYYGGYGYPYASGYRYPSYSNGYYNSAPDVTYAQPYSTTVPQTSYYPSFTNPSTAGFTVRLPDPNAEVWFQNYKTQQTGTVRQFQSESLDPTSSYMFQVRARWMQNGQMMDQTRQVPARAGQSYSVDFSSEAVPASPANRTTFDSDSR